VKNRSHSIFCLKRVPWTAPDTSGNPMTDRLEMVKDLSAAVREQLNPHSSAFIRD
jgi:hypothetical protein